jgi:hypothetical protein
LILSVDQANAPSAANAKTRTSRIRDTYYSGRSNVHLEREFYRPATSANAKSGPLERILDRILSRAPFVLAEQSNHGGVP